MIRSHGIIDYAAGIVLLVAPLLFGFADGRSAQYATQALGDLILLMSLLTAYEFSVAKLIPHRVHLGGYIVVGAVILISPWLFRFADKVWWPHVAVGLVSLVAVALSCRGVVRNGSISQIANP